MLAAGARLGPYELLSPLGAGGMGEVYRARDPRLGREVAIKVLPAAVSTDPERLRRFEREARAASALNDPNILVVHELGVHDGAPYLVTELLEGETLRRRLDGGALPPRAALEIALQVARGLAAAHDRRIVQGSREGGGAACLKHLIRVGVVARSASPRVGTGGGVVGKARQGVGMVSSQGSGSIGARSGRRTLHLTAPRANS
jgi:Protein kinase domain